MARRKSIDTSLWPSLTIEGYLIAPAMLTQISNLEADTQKPESYRLRKGISIKDEISTAFRVGQAHYEDYKKTAKLSSQSTLSFMQGLLKEVFGYDDLERDGWENRLVAGKRVSIDIVSKEEKLENFVTRLSVFSREPVSIELMDDDRDPVESIWRLVTNGQEICLFRPNESLTRPAYINANLARIFDNEDIASFSVLWLLTHRTRFGSSADTPSDCILERWREIGTSEGEVARDRLAGQVKLTLSILGSGFIEANPELASKLQSGEVQLTDWFNELLRLVYRLIFVMVAEDRNLLHPKTATTRSKTLYEQGYSFSSLRKKSALSGSRNRHHDGYEVVKIVFKALSSLDGLSSIGLPGLGGLFDENNLPTIGRAQLQNKVFMAALFKLSWIQSKDSIVPVNWRDMKIEELGSVYESLLDLNPQLGEDRESLQFAVDTIEAKGSQRKTTGSYYTPERLVQELLRSALDPVLDKAEAEAKNKAEALLRLNVIDPACGSGHFLIAAAYRLAKRIEDIRLKETNYLPNYQDTLREVVRRCIFGVDINPMAIEIVKFVLWVETLTPGLPLGFFDAQIRCGDSLLGVFNLSVLSYQIPDVAYKSLTGDSKTVANYYKLENRKASTGQGEIDLDTGESYFPPPKPDVDVLAAVRRMPEDSSRSISVKRDKYKQYRNSAGFNHAKLASDLYIAAFISQKTGVIPESRKKRLIPITLDVWQALNRGKMRKSLQGALNLARRKRAFHWPLEFLDVVRTGGFDVVLGNPPWERIKIQETEFFATDAPEIANSDNASKRGRKIEALQNSEYHKDRMLYLQFIEAKHFSEAKSLFVRVRAKENGRFPYTGRGDVNTYALFAELFASLLNGRGQAGIILPTGIATDYHTSTFFAWLIRNKRIVSLYDFENKKRFFKDVHAQFKFCLLTLGTNIEFSQFAFFVQHLQQLEDNVKTYHLSVDDLWKINPNTGNAPVFRSRYDGSIAKQIYSKVPVLIDERKRENGNPWGVRFISMYHMANDSHLFQTKDELTSINVSQEGSNFVNKTSRYIPLYEAKMIYQYNHRFTDARSLNERPISSPWPTTRDTDLKNPKFETMPWYWVSEIDFKKRISTDKNKPCWISYRDVSNSTSERTIIASAVYKTALSGGLPAMYTKMSASKDVTLLGLLNSLVVDYIARLKLGGNHLAFHVVKQFPVLPPEYFDKEKIEFVTPRVLELTYTSFSMRAFAQVLGYQGNPFVWDDRRRAELKAELDAFYTKAYGLNKLQLRFILDPADVKGPDYPSETFRVLKNNEIKEFGEYRTQRLVLEAWDRFESNGTFVRLGM